jgi:hypothetical protein
MGYVALNLVKLEIFKVGVGTYILLQRYFARIVSSCFRNKYLIEGASFWYTSDIQRIVLTKIWKAFPRSIVSYRDAVRNVAESQKGG